MARKNALCFAHPPPWPDEVEAEGEHFYVIGRWHFLVESATEPDTYHAVDLEPVDDLAGHCTCRSGETRKTCRHENVVRGWAGLVR